MGHSVTDWRVRGVLMGALVIALHWATVPYVLDFAGAPADEASLAHLHTGVLLAIALLDRDRRVFALATAFGYLGWASRAWNAGYPTLTFLTGAINTVVVFGWTLACVKLAGWPRPVGEPFPRERLPALLVSLLLAYPAGVVVAWLVLGVHDSWQQHASAALQMFFAKFFGAMVVAIPLAVGWTDRHRAAVPLTRRGWAWSLLLLGAAVLGVVVARGVPALAAERAVVLMDYRFALVAALGWCVLFLRPPVAMAALAVSLYAMVRALAQTATHGATPIGFANLLYLALELAILLVAIVYLYLLERDMQASAARLAAETRLDAVTRLPNLHALTHRLAQLPPSERELGCLLLDQADSLSPGRGLGTQAEMMNAVAGRIADLAEVFHVGTGQFAVLVHPVGEGVDAWQRLLTRVEQLELGRAGHRIRLLPYLGVSVCRSDDPESIDFALLQSSQLAHEAKQQKAIAPLHAHEDADGDVVGVRKRMHEAAEAIAALRGQRVVLMFQAIQRLQPRPGGGNGIHGEVLARLRTEDGTLLDSSQFMRAVEATGRGAELDLAVLHALREWVRAHPRAMARVERLSVNLTGQSLASPEFRARLLAMLDEGPLRADRLCFEVIETAAIASPMDVHAFLATLRDRGATIAIDDFGVGLQSFERLKQLPVDLIKIDGSFVRQVVERADDRALVQACVAVARAFRAETLAEYVDSERVADCLRGLGVDWMQGYLVSKPLPIAEALRDGD